MPPRDAPPDAAALAVLPLVGAILGITAGGAGTIAARVVPGSSGAVAYAALIVMTGAIHIDGFLDGCDAFFASVSPERRREILKDPRHGTFAVAGMFAVGSLAVSALSALPLRRLAPALAFSAALARAAAVAGAFMLHGADGAPTYPCGARERATLGATFVALGAAACVIAPRAVLCVPGAVVGTVACQRWVRGRVASVSGDAHGFTIVLTEVAILCALAAFTSREA